MKIINEQGRLKKYIVRDGLGEILPEGMTAQMELCSYEPSETVLEHGAPMHYFYFFVSGKLKIYQTQPNGRTLLIQFYSYFDSLGEVELMNGLPASCSVVAVEPSELIRIPMDVMQSQAIDYPPFLRYIIRSLSLKLIHADDHHAFNLLFPVKQRLASYLIEHSGGAPSLRLMDQLQEIADYLGTTYRQLHRAFNALSDEGVIKKEGKIVHIADFGALKVLAGEIYVVSAEDASEN